VFDLRAHTVLLVVGGSRAYGIHTEASDVDLKGCCVPPPAFFHGFLRTFEQQDDPAQMASFVDLLTGDEAAAARAVGLEGTVYGIRKLLRLGVKSNPNIFDLLFCREREVRWSTPIGDQIRSARDLFLSQRAHDAFAGYATAQLKRMQTHRGWLLHPPAARPERADFGLPDAPVSVPDRTVPLSGALIEALKRERSFQSAMRGHQQYTHWLRSRNPERAALEARFGYDTKHGAHLVRLLRMGVEILSTGTVHVWRGPGGPDDAGELRAIRAGAWSYDALMDWAASQQAALSAAREFGSALPAQPDREAVDRLCVALVEAALSGS